MKRPDRAAAEPWVQKAEEDLKVADLLLGSQEAHPSAVCYHAQQAAEKLLKGALAAIGVVPRKTHDLGSLVAELAPIKPGAQIEDAAEQLTPFAWSTRYPTETEPTAEEARLARSCAEEVKNWVDFVLRQDGSP